MTTCPTCAERRAAIMKAWQERQIAEAVRQAALGVRDMVKGNGDESREA